MRQTDIVPISSTGPTVNIPPAKEHLTKVFQVARTDTTASVKAVLPADATIVDIRLYTGTASDAATTATLSVGSSATSNEYLNAADVKTAAGLIRPTTALRGIYVVQPVPLGGDFPIYAKYAETGTASTTGGPWFVSIDYIR